MLSMLMLVPVVAVAERTSNPEPPALPHQAEVGCAHARSDGWRVDNADAPAILPLQTDGLSDTDVLHYNLDLQIIPGSPNTLTGTNIITVKCLDDNVTTFPVRLHQNFTITSLQVNDVNATSTRFNVADLQVNLNQAFNTNDQFQVKISYTGTPTSGGFGSVTFTTQGGSPVVYTLSEPYYAYTWWPAKEDNRDKATADLAFTVPNTMKVASNGLLQGTDVLPGSKLRYRWKTNYPTAPYLFSFAATNYNEFSDTWMYPGLFAPMPMRFYIYPGSDTPSNRNAWLATKQMLTTFSDLFGVYPFAGEKYGIYQFGFGGGMEHQTMTGQGTFSNSVTAHELAHQWWGDKLTCASWGHIWLNEGFATYCEALWQEFQPGSTGTAALLTAMSNRRPSSMDTVVYRYDTSSASIIFSQSAVYYKGAWVLHMLRHMVGDEMFFDIINTYHQQFAYSAVTTEDLRAIAESFYGSSLATYFNQWVYLTGAPTYQTAYRNVTAGGSSYLELYIKQVQNSSWATFEMPIDIVTTTAGTPTATKVWNDERAEHLLFAAPGNVTALQVDPNNYILHPSNQTTTFVEGPPKIVKMQPAPGSSQLAGGVTAIQVTFHKNVNAAAGHFLLSGLNTGSIPFTFSYSAAALTATLTPTAPLPADTYTLSVAANLTDVASGKALDGEVLNPGSASSLPSGDGLPGGAAVLQFAIVPPACPSDIAAPANGLVDVNDMLAVINSWGACSGCAADITNDGQVDVMDLLAVIDGWGQCP